MAQGFGFRFGLLVRTKRKSKGLTQQMLAEAAFGKNGKKERISELENGKVGNPRATTVEALAGVLGITDEELLACHAPQPLPQETGLPPALLENLALRFGHDNPDAPPSELEAFLKEKAKDFRAMQARLEALAAAEGRIANLLAAAQGAIAAGDFDEADARLADAEEMQQAEHTLKKVRKQADLRLERARAALLKGDADAAAGHFEAAAGFFAPFDVSEQAQMLFDKAKELYFHGLRFGGVGLARAADFGRRAVDLSATQNDRGLWGKAQNNLGLALQEQGKRTGGAEGAKLLGEAVEAYRAALTVFTRQEHPVQWATTQNNLAIALSDQGERTGGANGAALLGEAVEAYRAALTVRTRQDHPVQWATTQNNLANALQEQGKRTSGAEGAALLGEAVAAYRAALTVRTRQEHPFNWAMTQNNLANALQEQGKRSGGAEGAALLSEAVAAYRAALTVRTRQEHPVDWAMKQNNLANALQEQGKRTSGAEGAALLGEAVAAYRAALTVYTRQEHPVAWAVTQNNLGEALRNQGARSGGAEGARLLGEAVEAYRAALTVRTRQDHPVQWAMTQENLGLAFESWAGIEPQRARELLAGALVHFDAALTVYDPVHMPYDHGTATEARAGVMEKLVALEGE